MNEGSDRRTFLKRGVLLTTAAATTGAAGAADVTPDARAADARPTRSAGVPDPVLLRALAEVVLPSELGAQGREGAVRSFERWIDTYEPAFEMNHGYGTHEIMYGPAHPGPGWEAQLEAMDVEARSRAGTGFSALSLEERRIMLERQLSGERGGLPAPARAHHVAVGLLAHWASSSEAHDLAYRSRIRRQVCRGLEGLGGPPPPLSGDAP